MVVVVPRTDGLVEILDCLVVGEVVVLPPEVDGVDDFWDFLLGDVETLVMMMRLLVLVVFELCAPVVVVGAVDEGEVVDGDFVARVVVVLAASAKAGWPIDLNGTLL